MVYTTMARIISLPSPAKVNRFLHIIGRRSDGFHQLQTIFQMIDLMDTLSFEVLETPEIKVTPALSNTPLENNLIYKAAKRLQELTGCQHGIHVHMNKQIPMGGGCGGGSSNAATTLLALNALWSLDLSFERIMEIGSVLGSDVCAFLVGHASWGEGRGEQLTFAEPSCGPMILAIPNCHCDTAFLYKHPNLTRDTPACKIGTQVPQGAHNDFEPLVRSIYPEVEEAFRWLSEYSHPQLNGSGSSVFALFETIEEAKRILEKKPKSLYATVVQALEVSPLIKAIKQENLELPSNWGVAKR